MPPSSKKEALRANAEKARAARGGNTRLSLRQTRGSASSTVDHLQEVSTDDDVEERVSEIPFA